MPFALILADVDRFKSVNDTYGHETGDAILKEFSAQLRAAFRSTDFIFRIGGDEFAVLMPDATEQIRTSIGESLSALRRGADPGEGAPAPGHGQRGDRLFRADRPGGCVQGGRYGPVLCEKPRPGRLPLFR